MSKPTTHQLCPCCGANAFSDEPDFEICETCRWENDPIQLLDPYMSRGANEHSLIQARINYQTTGYSEPQSFEQYRPPSKTYPAG